MTKLEQFCAIIDGLQEATLDAIIDRLDAADYFDDDFFATVIDSGKRTMTRGYLKRIKGPDGRPLWYSVLAASAQDTRRRYKQLELFDLEDFRQAIDYAVTRAQYWQGQAETLREALSKRYGEQLTLPWE